MQNLANGGRAARGGWLPLLVALVVPALIIAPFLQAVHDFPPDKPPGELADAAAKIERQLKASKPEIFIVGNSISNVGIDEGLLRKTLGVPVLSVSVPHSQAPAWYAVLKNRVFANGYRPKLVILANPIVNMLGLGLGTEDDHIRLQEQITEHEPVLDQKMFGEIKRGPTAHRMHQNRTRMRHQFMERVRNFVVGVLFAPPGGGGVLAAGKEKALPALERTFDDDELDLGLFNITDEMRDEVLIRKDQEDPNKSLIPDILDEAERHGSRLVVVKMPLAPGNPGETTSSGTLRNLIHLLNERGAAYVDLKIPFGPADFSDPNHLTRGAAQRFTTELSERLQEIDALSKKPFPRAAIPFAPPAVTRDGEQKPFTMVTELGQSIGPCGLTTPTGILGAISDPMLAVHGVPASSPVVFTEDGYPLNGQTRTREFVRDCPAGRVAIEENSTFFTPISGDPYDVSNHVYGIGLNREVSIRNIKGAEVYWVYPDTTLNLDFPEGWDPERGAFEFRLAAQPFLGKGGVPTVSYAGKTEPLQTSGGRMVALLSEPAPDGPWHVAIHSPPDGPFLGVIGATVGQGAGMDRVLNPGRDSREIFLHVIGGASDETQQLHYESDPTPLSPTDYPLTVNEDGTGTFFAPDFAFVNDHESGKCSPLVVLEDGAPLSRRHEKCSDVARTPGSQCHMGNQVLFRPRGGRTVLQRKNRPNFRLALDRPTKQSCRTNQWLLAGDSMRGRPGKYTLKRFYEGASIFEMSAGVMSRERQPTSYVHVKLTASTRTLLDIEVPTSKLERGFSVEMPGRVYPYDKQVLLEITNPPDGDYVLLRNATIYERDEDKVVEEPEEPPLPTRAIRRQKRDR